MDSQTDVKSLYERRPYPHYPLFAKPKWQDGYLGYSLFAQRINKYQLNPIISDAQLNQHNFLSIGCGEMLPYIIRQWELPSKSIDCVDLSERSLSRARFRTALLGRSVNFHQGDINQLLQEGSLQGQVYSQIEAYGVLHHISNFNVTLKLISQCLHPSGVLRIMIYNSEARTWIWEINRAFKNLGLTYKSNRDLATARSILTQLKLHSPLLTERLHQMGPSALNNDSRFADTFLHPWESRASIQYWFDSFSKSNLQPIALFDRYAELDDLKNPLWTCPTAEELTERALDLRFENNLELWLTPKNLRIKSQSAALTPKSSIPLRLKWQSPTSRFDAYSETKKLSPDQRKIIWKHFIGALHGASESLPLNGLKSIDIKTLSRLARIGLLLPQTARKLGLYDELNLPMSPEMTPPIGPPQNKEVTTEQIQLMLKFTGQDAKKTELAARRLIRIL